MIYIKNSKIRYGLITILLHWIMAILIIGLFILGKYMVDLDYYDHWYHTAPWWHKSIGVCVFVLLLIRLFWRFSNITPEPLQTYKTLEIKAAKAVHFLFYVLLLIICISGYFISTAKGVGVEVFGWLNVPPVTKFNDTEIDIFGKIHEKANHILVMMFILHLVAVFKHHFFNKDITLIRMLSPVSQKENPNENYL